MTSKQEKGGATTANRASARRAKIAVVVAILADRNREKPWKWIAREAARLCDVGLGRVLKSEEATAAFRWAPIDRNEWLNTVAPAAVASAIVSSVESFSTTSTSAAHATLRTHSSIW